MKTCLIIEAGDKRLLKVLDENPPLNAGDYVRFDEQSVWMIVARVCYVVESDRRDVYVQTKHPVSRELLSDLLAEGWAVR